MLIIRIWKDQPGKYFCFSTKDRSSNWEDHFFSRKEFPKIKEFIESNKDKDLYFCPHGFSRRRRLKQFAEAPHLLYADLDEADPSKIEIKPTIAIESSPGRYVGIWLVDKIITEDINRRLTYLVGADKGGWDLTQVLRVPGTYNYKYQSTPKVRLKWLDGPGYKLDDILSQLPTQNGTEAPEGHQAVAYEIYKKHEKNLSVFARREILRGRPTRGKRSEVFWRLVQEVMESGLSTEEAYELLRVSPWNKFAGRRNEEEQIKREIKKALKQHLPEGRRHSTDE